MRRNTRVGYDYVHSAVDDHTRLAHSEICSDEKGDTTAQFMTGSAAWFQGQGISRIEEVMTDNHWSYTNSRAFAPALETIGARHVTIRPHRPWQNGKERFNRNLQTEWAYRQVFTNNHQRAQALPTWLDHYNHRRSHSPSEVNRQPASQLSPT